MGNNMSRVINGLYVGGMLGSDGKEKLKEKGITHVLSIHDNAEPQHPNDFEYKCIKVSDNSYTDLSVYFSECADFVHGSRMNNGAVYIHCAAGISRAVTMTVMYLMTVSTLDFQEALTVVQFCREVANPNHGFRMQLMKYEQGKLKEERKRLRQNHPDMSKLNDEQQLKDLLKQAREKFSKEPDMYGRSREPYPFNPDAFTAKKLD